ncbi:subtilisin savinase [Halalkalibacter akibai JCM 9157]|uniref:Subtilisin savinase n=1 Tax=Halalkalibacter akibai (strain ATCC 43226 / DSM 21942 / CIP 109018 / JCM 9157 / 1139) TaxID=1236973 RepID=W4QV67_HALA3|nr:subtilisin savinase [Halalkalibacter akibai JCM 9157]
MDEQQKVRIQTLETDTTRVIVSFKDQIVEQVVEESAGEIIEVMDTVPVLTANIPTDELNDLEENPQVEHVEEDQVIMIQNEQVSWGMNRISVGSAWNSALTGKGVSVAVIDTGIDRNHQDLKVVGGVSTVDYTDSYHDDNGHGTHVAGIIAALHNGIGIRGVAPDIELFSVKALDETGAGYVSDIVSAIDWSIRNNIDIINLSIGMPRHSHSLETIVNRAYERGAY